MDTNLAKFIDDLEQSYTEKSFRKMLISKPKDEEPIKKITIRIVDVKGEALFSFTYEYPSKHVVKNYKPENVRTILSELLGVSFKNAILFTSKNDIHLVYSKKMKAGLFYNKPTVEKNIPENHNREKNRLIALEDNLYLQELGITTKDGKLIPKMSDKYIQINKYIETVRPILEDFSKTEEMGIVDLGSGKGYLTFAVYDFLKNVLKQDCSITGIEIRKELVDYCNSIAQKCSFDGLRFEASSIQDFKTHNKIDVLIALHACDTATDDAIFKGIKSNASAIIVAPCCHKQIRKELNVNNELKHMARYGILKERLAESVTDTLRSIVLEIFGYRTNIFEFISDAHTPKNVMITAIKKHEKNEEKVNDLTALKGMFGIKYFYLEELLKKEIHS